MAALLMAGEEISWGQRILGIVTPEPLREANRQGEITLHNLEAIASINDASMLVLALAVGLALVLSAILPLWRPRWTEWLWTGGSLLISWGLFPTFLLAPLVFLTRPVIKLDEIGEWMLGLAVAAWAARLALHGGGTARPLGWRGPATTVAALSAVAVIAGVLTYSFSVPTFAWRLNRAAAVDYPAQGMYEQAFALFAYIEARPEYADESAWEDLETVRRLAAEAALRDGLAPAAGGTGQPGR